ncbi:MAG TPA: hypothetical protein VK595_11545 [Vicinamibacterales bacterium]|nr:hypothetical protein [Vicinamibacterales bacterium]
MPDPFISTTDVVNYIGRGGTADAGMVIAVDAACDTCRTISEQSFNAATSTITLDGTGTDTILLPESPVTAAGTVVVAGGAVTDYVLNGNGILIRKQTGTDVDYCGSYTALKWPAGRQNVVVTYDHGYADADIPRDVRMVALAIASRLVLQGPLIQETLGETSARYGVNSTDLTNGELRILRKYRQTR